MLIAFEGIDGSGKTTQAELLSKRLAGEGIDNEVLREPGGTKLGEGVRELLLHRTDLKINPATEFLLFSASRAQLVREKIIPLLEQDKIVILDRYFYSSIAYQGFGRGIPIEEIETVSKFATQNVVPDIVFLVDLNIETALQRRMAAGRGADRMENSEVRFFESAIGGFSYCAKKEPSRFVIVDGREPAQRISDKVFDVVMCRIKKVAEEGNAP
ncbi:MAG: dTMP kinase [Bacteroidetes bacterium]|nr:dTMP kinase [Bacteroidota bacterium]